MQTNFVKKLFLVSVLVSAFLSSACKPAQPTEPEKPVSPPQLASKLKISNIGALLSLHTKDNKVLLGGGRVDLREGLVLRYKTKSGEQVVYVVGGQSKGFEEKTGESAIDSLTSTTVKTADGKLEMRSGYMLDEKTNELFIERTIINLSAEPIELTAVQQFVDPRLVVEPMAGEKARLGFLPQLFELRSVYAGEGGLLPIGFNRDRVYSRQPPSGPQQPNDPQPIPFEDRCREALAAILRLFDCIPADCGEAPPCPSPCLGKREFPRCIACQAKNCEDYDRYCCAQCNDRDCPQCEEKPSKPATANDKSAAAKPPMSSQQSMRELPGNLLIELADGKQKLGDDVAINFLRGNVAVTLVPVIKTNSSGDKSWAQVNTAIKLPSRFN